MKRYDPILYLTLALLFAASCMNTAAAGRSGGGLLVEAVRGGRVIASERTGGPEGSAMRFGGPGNFNEITIGEGVRMASADCPGGDCLRAGEIKKAGEVLVCVPHKLVIRLASRRKPDMDAVSY